MTPSPLPIPGSGIPSLAFHAVSHSGLVLSDNGDNWHHIHLPQGDDLFLVADSAASVTADGHAVSQHVLAWFEEWMLNHPELPVKNAIEQSLQNIHDQLQELIPPSENEFLGCQFVGIWIDATHHIASGIAVGRCRAYLFRNADLMCLTQDHPPAPTEQNATFPLQLAWLGGQIPFDTIKQWIPPFKLHPGDLFLLCSDGLASAASEQEMAQILVQHRSGVINQTCQYLVFQALQAGGSDNITVLIAEIPGVTKTPAALTLPSTAWVPETSMYDAQLPLTQEQLVQLQVEHVQERRYQRIFLWLTVLVCLLLFIYFFTSVSLEKHPSPRAKSTSSPGSLQTDDTRNIRQPSAPSSARTIQNTPLRHVPERNMPPRHNQTSRTSPHGMDPRHATPRRVAPLRLDVDTLPFAPPIPLERPPSRSEQR